MAKKLYIGNVAWSVGDAELLEAFSKFGEIVDAFVMKDRETKRSRGFGFVTFENDGDAEAAVAAMNGVELNGRALIVNEARPKD